MKANEEQIALQLAESAKEKERLAAEAERLRREADSKREAPSEVREGSHPHPLKLLPTIYKGQYICDKCQVRGSGQVYHCDICNFDMHPTCCVEYAAWQGSRPVPLSPTLRDSRHPHALLQLPSVYQGSYSCAICGGSHTGDVYHCDLCKWDICPRCVKLS